jgi:NAD+ kinase
MAKSAKIQSVLIHGKALEEGTLDQIKEVLSTLFAHGVGMSLTQTFSDLLEESGVNIDQYGLQSPKNEFQPDMVLSMGGDGTVLETASLDAVEGTPVLGINTGRLGFLAHLPLEGASQALPSILEGAYVVESRNRLEVDFPGVDFELGRHALNEVTVHRRDVASMIRISVHRDGTFINRYWADGLIVSTATGSTAYSLSCGGPIVHPDSNAIVLNPIAPHNLNDRPLVIPSDGTLDIYAEGRDDHLMLTLDTRSHKVSAPAHFKVRRGQRPFLLVQLPGVDFIETVRRKLHFGMDGREGPSQGAAQENLNDVR